MCKFVGVDIGGTKMYLMAKWNDEYIEKKVPTGVDVSKEYIKKHLEDFIKELPFEPIAIGITLPGLVDNNDTLVISTGCPKLNGVKAEYFETSQYKVYFINDVKAALVGEIEHYPTDATVALIMVGTGIALTVQTNGMTVLGSKGWAGELGTVPICIDNKVMIGDDLCGGQGILNQAKTDINELLKAIDNKESWATKIIQDASFYFGLYLVNVIHMFNPDYIVVGGSTSTFKGYMENAISTAKKYSLEDCFNCCSIIPPKDNKRLVALGARQFAMNMYNNKL